MEERILWPHADFFDLSDEFLVRGCRTRFIGGWITVNPASAGADAPAVLTNYANALKRHLGYGRLLTRDEFGSLPPWSSQNATVAAAEGKLKDRKRDLAAARQEVLAAYPRLSQCYDYFQSAKSSEDFLFDLYKMIETIEDEYGGERQAGKALGLATEIKRLKRFANDRQHDHRHAPASPGNAAAITDAERGQTLEDARVILEAYAAAACR